MTAYHETIDEQQQISETLRGNSSAFQPIVETHWNLVFAVINRKIKDPETVADLCQETFLSAFAKLDQFKTEHRLAPWLAKIAVNKALEHIRKDCRAVFVDFDLDLSCFENTNPATAGSGRELFDSCIENLPEGLQILFIMRHGLGFSYDDIAYVLDLPTGTIKASFFRIRQQLKLMLEKDENLSAAANGG